MSFLVTSNFNDMSTKNPIPSQTIQWRLSFQIRPQSSWSPTKLPGTISSSNSADVNSPERNRWIIWHLNAIRKKLNEKETMKAVFSFELGSVPQLYKTSAIWISHLRHIHQRKTIDVVFCLWCTITTTIIRISSAGEWKQILSYTLLFIFTVTQKRSFYFHIQCFVLISFRVFRIYFFQYCSHVIHSYTMFYK